jgi:hypothetical protein
MKAFKFIILLFFIFITSSCVKPDSINLQMEQLPAEQLETTLNLKWKL